MGIQSTGEYQIIMKTILMKIDRRIDEQPNNTALVGMKRVMEESAEWVKSSTKLDAKRINAFEDAASAMRETFRGDTQLSDQLFDLLDWLEYRVG
ncbi:MAG: hypothetical protein IT372_11560 [Polyangiaceae bacterium]|nr:hypothetical protein [Polyangiaceae bacterium]